MEYQSEDLLGMMDNRKNWKVVRLYTINIPWLFSISKKWNIFPFPSAFVVYKRKHYTNKLKGVSLIKYSRLGYLIYTRKIKFTNTIPFVLSQLTKIVSSWCCIRRPFIAYTECGKHSSYIYISHTDKTFVTMSYHYVWDIFDAPCINT